MKRILGITLAILLIPLIATAQESLGKPTLTAEVGEDSISLSWSSVPDADNYELYTWENVGKWQNLSGETGLQSTSFEHTNLHDGATYFYLVRAVDGDGNSGPWSDRIKAPFKPLPAPTLTVTLNGSTATIEWSEVAGASGYTLGVHTEADDWEYLAESVTERIYTHESLTVGTTYTYSVSARNARGNHGLWSENVSVTVAAEEEDPTATSTATATTEATATPTATATAEPTSTATATATTAATATPTATPESARTVTITPSYDIVEDSMLVTWDAPADCGVSHYILTRTHTAQGIVHTETFRIGGSLISYTDESIQLTTTYEYVLTAHCTKSAAAATATPTPTATPTATPNTLHGITIAPENRCSEYDSSDYSYPQSVEEKIVAQQGGRIYSPYTGAYFDSTTETDIEHIVARSEAHDSGLCAATVVKRREFARDLVNLTLASPSVNRHQKIAKDLAEWLPTLNQCWYANQVVVVKKKYNLTMDQAEAKKAKEILDDCESTVMVFTAKSSPTPTATATATATPSPTATLTPTPTPTIDPDLYCTLIEYADGDERFASIKVPLIQNDTLTAYRNKYGENLEDLDIFSVDYFLDGRIAIWYIGEGDTWNTYRVVAEFYRGCEFLGHTDWIEPEY